MYSFLFTCRNPKNTTLGHSIQSLSLDYKNPPMLFNLTNTSDDLNTFVVIKEIDTYQKFFDVYGASTDTSVNNS